MNTKAKKKLRRDYIKKVKSILGDVEKFESTLHLSKYGSYDREEYIEVMNTLLFLSTELKFVGFYENKKLFSISRITPGNMMFNLNRLGKSIENVIKKYPNIERGLVLKELGI